MSFEPAPDPVPGDKKSCEALEIAIVPRMRDIGAFNVHRVLPAAERRMVGPFVFFDQMGPASMAPGKGMDVRPHPHIGLSTVTYLFNGAIRHRDSLGTVMDILPGAMNLMTAGRGIAHSERSPDAERAAGQYVFGIQSWLALPQSKEEIDPGFQHFAADHLPIVTDKGLTARIIAGEALGAKSPVGTVSPWFYVDVQLAAGMSLPLAPDYEERAIHIAEGEIEVEGKRFTAPQMLVFKPGGQIVAKAVTPARLLVLGGEALDGPRFLWWNFVSSHKERIEQAKEDWKQNRFAPVPGETEFIPLPDN